MKFADHGGPEIQVAKLNIQKANQLKPDTQDEVVTRETIRLIQKQLNRLGCAAGRADGLWGKGSGKALSEYSKRTKKRYASAKPTIELYDDLRSIKERVCH